MFCTGRLVLRNYIPKVVERGMLFMTSYGIDDDAYMQIWECNFEDGYIEEIPTDVFFEDHGYPVELYLIDENELPIAEHDQIAWWANNEDDELRLITINDVNYILKEYDGYIDIDIDEHYASMEIMDPILFQDKVIVREPIEEEEE